MSYYNEAIERCRELPFGEQLVTKFDVAKILALSVRTIEKHSRKMLARRKVGKRVLYSLRTILHQLDMGKDPLSGK